MMKYTYVAILLILLAVVNQVTCYNMILPKSMKRMVSSIVISSSLMFQQSNIQPALAVDDAKALAAVVQIKGTVVLDNGAAIPLTNDNAALYITVKQDVGAWTSAVRNIQPPALLTKKILSKDLQFPFTTTLDTTSDSTPEGLNDRSWKSGYLPLIITARYDADGVAATRSKDDLIGRTISNYDRTSKTFDEYTLKLGDRGLGGRITLKQ